VGDGFRLSSAVKGERKAEASEQVGTRCEWYLELPTEKSNDIAVSCQNRDTIFDTCAPKIQREVGGKIGRT